VIESICDVEMAMALTHGAGVSPSSAGAVVPRLWPSAACGSEDCKLGRKFGGGRIRALRVTEQAAVLGPGPSPSFSLPRRRFEGRFSRIRTPIRQCLEISRSFFGGREMGEAYLWSQFRG
jgi:hypothetical protein